MAVRRRCGRGGEPWPGEGKGEGGRGAAATFAMLVESERRRRRGRDRKNRDDGCAKTLTPKISWEHGEAPGMRWPRGLEIGTRSPSRASSAPLSSSFTSIPSASSSSRPPILRIDPVSLTYKVFTRARNGCYAPDGLCNPSCPLPLRIAHQQHQPPDRAPPLYQLILLLRASTASQLPR